MNRLIDSEYLMPSVIDSEYLMPSVIDSEYLMPSEQIDWFWIFNAQWTDWFWIFNAHWVGHLRVKHSVTTQHNQAYSSEQNTVNCSKERKKVRQEEVM